LINCSVYGKKYFTNSISLLQFPTEPHKGRTTCALRRPDFHLASLRKSTLLRWSLFPRCKAVLMHRVLQLFYTAYRTKHFLRISSFPGTEHFSKKRYKKRLIAFCSQYMFEWFVLISQQNAMSVLELLLYVS
jgi:hypothetical protein